ncbi:hypothetical protein DPMN_157511 [Dreissena polymorpha]|uniref:Uncharacterized protein n=1 Tax=Dreissena polymorpha TaxID=45954 RepID=A0A9D4IMC1_DREPO|nr:hypothetical protein DPMN_157511 [Dreissena polymorpha]
MWNSKIFRKASLAIGGIGVVAFQATIAFDANIRVKNSAKSPLTKTRVNLTEGFVYKKSIADEIKTEQASSFWVFPKLWSLGTKGAASWAIRQSDLNGKLKHQRLFVTWSAGLSKERKLGIGLTKSCDDDTFFKDVKFLDFEQLLEADKIEAFEMINIQKGNSNELVVDTGNILIVASMGLKWRALINVEVKESNKKRILVKQPTARTNEASLDTKAASVESFDVKAAITESLETEAHIVEISYKEKMKLAILLLFVILGSK